MDITDEEGDREAGIRTLPVILGIIAGAIAPLPMLLMLCFAFGSSTLLSSLIYSSYVLNTT